MQALQLNDIVTYTQYLGPEFIFLYDNDRPHVARAIQHYLGEVVIKSLLWLTRNQDLNPTEKLRITLVDRID